MSSTLGHVAYKLPNTSPSKVSNWPFWAILGLVSAIKSANVKISFSNFLDMCIGAKGRMSSKLRYVAPKLPDKCHSEVPKLSIDGQNFLSPKLFVWKFFENFFFGFLSILGHFEPFRGKKKFGPKNFLLIKFFYRGQIGSDQFWFYFYLGLILRASFAGG